MGIIAYVLVGKNSGTNPKTGEKKFTGRARWNISSTSVQGESRKKDGDAPAGNRSACIGTSPWGKGEVDSRRKLVGRGWRTRC